MLRRNIIIQLNDALSEQTTGRLIKSDFSGQWYREAVM
jgi:hypothetical protein